MAYAPFGETYAESGSPDLSFTGQDPDTNANLYDFMYREYGIQGRWPSPDPLGPGAFNLADPRSLDLYAYVRDSPTRLTDPFGLKTPIWEQLMQVSMVTQGSSIQFGSNWNEFEVLQTALTPTGSYRAPNCADPTTNDCGWSTVSVYGISGILDFIDTPGGIFDGPEGLLPSGPAPSGPQTPGQNNACTQPILNAVSNQFGPGTYSVTNTFPQGGATDLQITVTNLAASQFNALQTGRYPLNWWTYVIGYGPTLHVTGATLFDPNGSFSNSNIGGVTSVDFTAHIDSAFAYNPIGLVFHFFREKFASRS